MRQSKRFLQTWLARVDFPQGRRLRAALLCGLAVMGLAGCGYRVAGRSTALPEHILRVAIPTFGNKTLTPQLELPFTEAVKKEFSKRSRCQVVSDPADADALLQATILGYTVAPIGIQEQNVASTYLIQIQLEVKFTDLRDNKVLFRDPNAVIREEYLLSSNNLDFYVEEAPAIERAAVQYASSLVAAIVDAF